MPSGHLVFAREGRLLAVPFDPVRLEVKGPEVPVLDGINHSIYTRNAGRETGVAQFSFSQTGMLAYVAGSVFPELKFTPVWVDRQGREEALGVEPRHYGTGRVSAGGRQVLLNHNYPPRDVWLFDLDRQTLRRQTFEGNHTKVIWGPGAEYFTVDSDREGPVALYTKRVHSGPGEVERLENASLEGNPWKWPSSWSRDGKRLAFVMWRHIILPMPTHHDVWILLRDGKIQPFLQTRYGERWPEFSPDGRWIVYGSDESGRYEIYVRLYPGPGTAVQISTQGGRSPAWSRDGREIFFRQEGGAFYSVSIEADGERLIPGLPVELFEGRYNRSSPARSYDVAPDGRFLLMKAPDEAAMTAITEEFFPTRIRLIQNWFDELQRLVPTDR